MITDLFYEFKGWLKQCFCHHQYFYDSFTSGFTSDDYFKCIKCGRMVKYPPDNLIVKKIKPTSNKNELDEIREEIAKNLDSDNFYQ